MFFKISEIIQAFLWMTTYNVQTHLSSSSRILLFFPMLYNIALCYKIKIKLELFENYLKIIESLQNEKIQTKQYIIFWDKEYNKMMNYNKFYSGKTVKV